MSKQNDKKGPSVADALRAADDVAYILALELEGADEDAVKAAIDLAITAGHNGVDLLVRYVKQCEARAARHKEVKEMAAAREKQAKANVAYAKDRLLGAVRLMNGGKLGKGCRAWGKVHKVSGFERDVLVAPDDLAQWPLDWFLPPKPAARRVDRKLALEKVKELEAAGQELEGFSVGKAATLRIGAA